MIVYANEVWRNISNSNYEVSNYGRFRRKYKYKYRYLKTFKKGALYIIKLHINDKDKDYNVAKLVIESFIRKLKPDECVYHKNGIISDNKLSNLEILTRSEAGKRTGWQSRRKGLYTITYIVSKIQSSSNERIWSRKHTSKNKGKGSTNY